MYESVITFGVGILCVVLGIFNMRGNISSLHFYHRHRVSEEDRIPFGRQVGLGTVIVGVGITVFGGMNLLSVYTGNNIFITAGRAIFIVGIVTGLAISFHAMKKYNKGIF